MSNPISSAAPPSTPLADAATFEAARAHFVAGVQAFESDRWEEAQARFEASLRLLPGRPSTLANLAAVHLQLGRLQQALPLLDAVIAQEPDSIDGRMHRAIARSELGQLQEAVADLRHLLGVSPDHGGACTRLGRILLDLGDTAGGRRALLRAIALDNEVEVNRFMLAALDGQAGGVTPPRDYVRGLFDSYAERYDDHLVQGLGYRGPQQLLSLLPADWRGDAALDFGCGTGLAAPLLASRVAALDGVDLSPKMIEKARQRGGYRTLAAADAVEWLHDRPGQYDLVLAAEVFLYLGALEPPLAAAARVLRPGGWVLFSVEEAPPGAGMVLAPTSRYQHDEACVRAAAQAAGLQWQALVRGPLRLEKGEPLQGLFVALRSPQQPGR